MIAEPLGSRVGRTGIVAGPTVRRRECIWSTRPAHGSSGSRRWTAMEASATTASPVSRATSRGRSREVSRSIVSEASAPTSGWACRCSYPVMVASWKCWRLRAGIGRTGRWRGDGGKPAPRGTSGRSPDKTVIGIAVRRRGPRWRSKLSITARPGWGSVSVTWGRARSFTLGFTTVISVSLELALAVPSNSITQRRPRWLWRGVSHWYILNQGEPARMNGWW